MLIYPFYTSIASGAMEYANSKGYSVIVTSSENDHECEKKFSHLFSTKDIKGTIIAPVIEGASEIEREIGRKAGEILIRNIEASTLLPVKRIVLETEFIVRKSARVLNNKP